MSTRLSFPMPKVVMLVSNPFRPDVRVYKEAKTLVEKGYDVEVIAWDRDNAFKERERISVITITRARVRSRYDNFLSMVLSLPLFYSVALWKLLRDGNSIVHCHDLDTLPLGFFAAKVKGTKVVYDAHESYPDMVADSSPPLAVGFLRWIEKYLVKRVDAVISTTEQMEKRFSGYGAKKLAVVANCAELQSPSDNVRVSELRASLGVKDETMLIYIGILESIRGLKGIIEGFGKHAGKEYKFVIGGFGPIESEIRKACEGVESVKFIGFVRLESVFLYNQAADVLIITSDPSKGHAPISVNNKVFEAMVAGRPVIVSRGTASAGIVESEHSGICIGYGNQDELFAALKRLRSDRRFYDELCRNGMYAARTKYNWAVMEERLAAIYESLAQKQT